MLDRFAHPDNISSCANISKISQLVDLGFHKSDPINPKAKKTITVSMIHDYGLLSILRVQTLSTPIG